MVKQPLLKTTLQYLKKGCSVEAVDSIVSSKAIIAFECRDPTREKSFLTLVNESLVFSEKKRGKRKFVNCGTANLQKPRII